MSDRCVVTTETSETPPARCPLDARWAVTLDGETKPMCYDHAVRACVHFGATKIWLGDTGEEDG